MANVGRTLGILNSIAMPGAWEPEGEGGWADPVAHRRRYLANVLADSRHLLAAGLTAAEVDRVAQALEDFPVDDLLMLCHGDVGPDHVFVDGELNVVGLIDWGQWYAGSASSELAGVAMTSTAADFDAIVAGHGNGAAARAELGWHIVTQATGQLGWLVTSGQRHEFEGPVTALRRALATIPV